jgi:hypothetical protein
MPADLALLLNLNQTIFALRGVRSSSELIAQDLPPLPGGTVMSLEIRLIDSTGAPWTAYLDGTYKPRILIYVNGPTGPVQLVLLGNTAFTLFAESSVNKGWTVNLPLNGAVVKAFMAGSLDSQLVNFEFTLVAPDGTYRLIYLKEATLLARDFDATTMPTTIEARPDITSAAIHVAIPTLGHSLPWLVLTLEPNWTGWTLRARTLSDPDNATIASTDPTGDSWRVPDDADPVANNVIWVRSALS